MESKPLPTDWKHQRSLKAAATRRQRYGDNVFKEMGSRGGKHPKKRPELPEIVPYESLKESK